MKMTLDKDRVRWGNTFATEVQKEYPQITNTIHPDLGNDCSIFLTKANADQELSHQLKAIFNAIEAGITYLIAENNKAIVALTAEKIALIDHLSQLLLAGGGRSTTPVQRITD